MKKVKILAPLLSIGVATGAIAPLASCSCSQTPITLDKTLTDKGYSVKSYSVGYLQDSYFELNTPNDKDIDDIEVKVGNLTFTKGDYLRINKKTVWINGKYMVDTKITIKFIQLVVKVTDLNTSYTLNWKRNETMKASDLTVKLIYDDDSQSEPLEWKTGYKIYKDDYEISNFDTTGYTFTKADATEGRATFKVVYVADTKFTKSFNVNVEMGPATLDDFLDQYVEFLKNYKASSTQYVAMSFDTTNAKFMGKSVTNADVDYTSADKAVAEFDCEKINTTNVGGSTKEEIKAYIDSFDDNTHTKEYTVTDDSITCKISLTSDPTKYDTVTYDKYTYITNWVNTFGDTSTYAYSGTNLTNVKYEEATVPFDIKFAGSDKTFTYTIGSYFSYMFVIDSSCFNVTGSPTKTEFQNTKVTVSKWEKKSITGDEIKVLTASSNHYAEYDDTKQTMNAFLWTGQMEIYPANGDTYTGSFTITYEKDGITKTWSFDDYTFKIIK